jgi:hypothetical protein
MARPGSADFVVSAAPRARPFNSPLPSRSTDTQAVAELGFRFLRGSGFLVAAQNFRDRDVERLGQVVQPLNQKAPPTFFDVDQQ